MAQVFLSYDREDGAKAKVIAQALERAGHFVWWDLHIKGGAEYGKVIEQALEQADSVVVLWSGRSVDSAWVRDEAAAGRDKGSLIPVLLEAVNPPMGFRQYQNLDFSNWMGRGKPPRMAELLASIEAPAAPAATARYAQPISPPVTQRWNAFLKWSVIAGAVIAILIVLSFVLGERRRKHVPVVAVTAAEQSAASKSIARDLLVQLGSLQASNADALQLVGSGSADKPDLLFEVSAATGSQLPGANLALLDGKSKVLLWSMTFEPPSGKQADLRQQLAYSAGQVLKCAAEAHGVDGALRAETRKLYLNGCAEFAARIGTDPGPVVDIFARVIEQAPKFRDGWAKLLLAEFNAVSNAEDTQQEDRARASLRHRIDQARKVDPRMAEIYLAQIQLLPERAYADRIQLADRAKQLEPDNPFVLVLRAFEVANVGRWSDAVQDASRAVELEPLLPSLRNARITLLAYSGRKTMAEEALKEAERLWPGAASVTDAKFRYHLRFGDPAQAMAIVRSEGSGRVHETYLEARIDPSPQNIERALEEARQIYLRIGSFGLYGQALSEFGREKELYDAIGRLSGPLSSDDAQVFLRPSMKRFRSDPRFMRVAARLGLLDYWRKSGNWPDFCFEPDLPYDCKAEAAKLSS